MHIFANLINIHVTYKTNVRSADIARFYELVKIFQLLFIYFYENCFTCQFLLKCYQKK